MKYFLALLATGGIIAWFVWSRKKSGVKSFTFPGAMKEEDKIYEVPKGKLKYYDVEYGEYDTRKEALEDAETALHTEKKCKSRVVKRGKKYQVQVANTCDRFIMKYGVKAKR